MEDTDQLLADVVVNDGELNPKDYPIPTYAIKPNEVMRHKIFREAGGMKSIAVKFFEELCSYVATKNNNSALVDLENFRSRLDTKTRAEFGDIKKISLLLSKMAEKLGENNLGVLSILKTDSEGNINTLALLDRGNAIESLYRKVERLLLQNLQEVKQRKGQFKSYKELKKEFHLYKKELESLVIEQSAKMINQKIIKDFSKKDKILIVLNLEHDIGNIVVPAKKLPNLVTLFIELVYSYYQDSANDSLRKIIKKKINKQKVAVETIVDAFRGEKLGSPHFLFFSQLFYTIMNKLSEKFYTQNCASNEVINQLIASRFLTLLSFNLREELRDEQVSKEKDQDLLRKVVDSLVTNCIVKSGKNIYYPATMADFLKVSLQTRDESGAEQQILAKDELSVEEIKSFIEQLDSDKHTIAEVIAFAAENKTYYVHRVRLMQSFLALVELERNLIENKVLTMWVNNPKQILSKRDSELFNAKVNKEYCSPLFAAFLRKIVEIFSAVSPVSGKAFDSAYFLDRLFFDENQGLRFERDTGDLIYLAKDFNRKKQILKAFFSTIFDKNYNSKNIFQILNINFYSLRKKALAEANIGFFSYFFDFLSNIFAGLLSNFSAFSGKKSNYIQKISDTLKESKEKMKTADGLVKAAKKKVSGGGGAAKKSSTSSSAKKEKGKELSGEVAQKVMLKSFPILKNSGKLNDHLEELSSRWNYKIGEAKDDFQETIDDCISEFARRFDASAFTKDGKSSVIERFMSTNRKIADEITDKKSFGEYVFYKAAFYKTK